MDNGYYEARQHLNLSQHAYDIIESDGLDFMERPSFAGMLNLAFSAYWRDADANIEAAVRRYKDELRRKAKNIPDVSAKELLIKALAESKETELAAKNAGYPSECQFKFQLSRENYAVMQDWHDVGGYYHSCGGRYIKAIIEEYASKSYYNREQIIFRDRLCLLQSFIDAGTMLSLTSGRRGSEQSFMVKPYCLCADQRENYHYLVGSSECCTSNEGEKPASFRVSRLMKITPVFSRSGRITAAQKKQIVERLNTVGVQFMTQEQEHVRVLLSPEGVQQFERQTFLRPACMEKHTADNGMTEYVFSCASMQAAFYFFKFGAEAEILSPPELRADFRERYKNAYMKYTGDEK